MNDGYDFRTFLAAKIQKKVDEARAEEASEQGSDSDRVMKIANKIYRSSSPPSYAKALAKAHARAVDFAEKVLKRVKAGDPDLVFRFICWETLLYEFAEELPGAIRAASNPNQFAMAEFPFTVFAEVLGEEYQAPSDGEHWPLPQREGPITWKD